MTISEVAVTRAIVDSFTKQLLADLELDVAIAGGGPAGLICAHDLAYLSRKVALFESRLSLGGGMWGGGMGYGVIVVQESGLEILKELGIRTKCYSPGYHVASSIEATATLVAAAARAGASLYNLVTVEDVIVRADRIQGVVVNASPIVAAGLHVDPISIAAQYTVEATGHPLEVLKKVVTKSGIRLATPSGGIEGERSLNAELGEEEVLKNTIEIAPGLYVAGMAANAALGAHRMGPIFGGMLLSGRRAAQLIHAQLQKTSRDVPNVPSPGSRPSPGV
ncbi:MAG: sulfide-dependent adenosine diphosphate thiazole synthase [candidate division WOR-3 bacterium]